MTLTNDPILFLGVAAATVVLAIFGLGFAKGEDLMKGGKGTRRGSMRGGSRSKSRRKVK
jgi:hypothetical protein